MSIILFTINLLIIPLFAEKRTLFRDQAVLDNENDPHRDTIYGEFIVFFDAERVTDGIIQQFLDLFECYSLNEDVVDLYPNTIDHWIYMDKKEGCDYEDDIEIEWDDYYIIGIEEDENIKQMGVNECVSRSVGSNFWNLNRVSPSKSNGIRYIQFDSSYDPNIDIIIMDSGIDASHSQFDGITINRIFDAYKEQSFFLSDHGTHVAGTVLGKDYGAFRAQSTQIKLIDVRIISFAGSTTSTNILNGYDAIINYLQSNQGKKAIINMSFGGGNSDQKNARLASIRTHGGISIAAAGNDNVNALNQSPASSPDTITVGAHGSGNKRAEFSGSSKSNYGDIIDIWAPGTNIKSSVPGGGTKTMDGTSHAAALVSGIAANILVNNPRLEFDDIKERLLDYAIYDMNDRRGNTRLPRVQAECEEYELYGTIRVDTNGRGGTWHHAHCIKVRQNGNVIVQACDFSTQDQWRRGAPDSDGYYEFISEYNNECLNADYGNDNIVNDGDNINTYPCHGGYNQKWKIDGKHIRLKPVSTSMNACLDYGDTHGGPGIPSTNNVWIWDCNDAFNNDQYIAFLQQTQIKSTYHTDKCLDRDLDNGDNVRLNPCMDDLTTQLWRRGTPDSDGYYEIISEHNMEGNTAYETMTPEYLDVNFEGNGNVHNSDNIYALLCDGSDSQRWKIDGTIIRHKLYGCLDGGDSGNNAHIWSCSFSNNNQLFLFPGFFELRDIEQTQIKSTYHTNKCLDVNYNNGNNVYLYSCHDGKNQEWRRGRTDSDGYYTLISEYDDKCLDASFEGNGRIDKSDNIYTHSCHGGDNQKWRIDGTIIRNKAYGCVDGGDSGNNVHIWSCSYSNNNQLFEFPGFSDVSGSSAFSIGNIMDDFKLIKTDESMESGYYMYLYQLIGILLLINLVCLMIHFWKKQKNSWGTGYKITGFGSETDIDSDLEDPNQ